MKMTKLAALLMATAMCIGSANTAFADEAEDGSTATAGGGAETAVPPKDRIVVEYGRAETAVFGKRPFMRAPRLSQDGSKLAVMMSKDGTDNLGWIDLSKAGGKPNFFVQAEEFREAGDRTVSSWQWVGNRIIVVTLLSREIIGGQRGDIRRLAAYNIETGKIVPLAWENSGADASDIVFIDDKAERIMIQRDTIKDGDYKGNPEVIEVDIISGKMKIVQRPNVEVSSWFVDGKGVVRAGAGGDGDSGKQRLMYRSDASGTFKTVQNLADSSFTGAQIYPSVFLDEPDMAYATSNKDGFRKVYKVNMKTMEIIGEPVFGLKSYDVSNILSNKADNDISGVSYTTSRNKIRWFDGRRAEIQSLLEEQFGKGNVTLVSTNEADTKIAFFAGKAHQPGNYHLFDTETGKVNLLGAYHPILKDNEMNPMDSIRYKASDGLEIEAVVTYPRHRPNRKNLPVIVMPHGGPFGVRDQEEFGFFPWHQAMAELGYVVIQPNYRGSGGYGKEFTKEGRKANGYGKRMQDDLNDALTWFGNTGLIDKNRACIMGWSYGGYATARGAQRDPDVWKCAIAGAGVYDMAMMNRWDEVNLSSFSAKFQDTSDDPNGISSAKNTDGKWSPILIVAALRDARIPIEQSRTLVSRLKGSGKKEGVDFRYIEQPKGTHNLPYEDVHIQWLEEAEAWARRFNPPYIESDTDKEPAITIKLPKAS
jgi:dipeptidyl aminopeptidase/acylaminoacyl peptidase